MGSAFFRFTVSGLMTVVLILAANFAVVRILRDAGADLGIVFVTLPMVNILMLSAPRAWKRNATRPYWIGFEIGGWLIASIFWHGIRHGILFRDAYIFPYVFSFHVPNSTYDWLDSVSWRSMNHGIPRVPCVLALDIAFYTPPQIIFAHVFSKVFAKCHEGYLYVSKKTKTDELSRRDK